MLNVFYCNLPFVIVRLFSKALENVSITRLHNYNFIVQYSRLNICHNFITISGVITWNKIPVALRIIISLSLFKQRLKSHLFSL
jgi:hypothetical protein